MATFSELVLLFTNLNARQALSPQEVNQLMMMNRQDIQELLKMRAEFQATKLGTLKDLKAEELKSKVDMMRIFSDLEMAGLKASSQERVALRNNLTDLVKMDGALTGRDFARRTYTSFGNLTLNLEGMKENWASSYLAPVGDEAARQGNLQELELQMRTTIYQAPDYASIKNAVGTSVGVEKVAASARVRQSMAQLAMDSAQRLFNAMETPLSPEEQEGFLRTLTNNMYADMQDPQSTGYIAPLSNEEMLAFNEHRAQRDGLVRHQAEQLKAYGSAGRSALKRFQQATPMLGNMNPDEIVQAQKDLLKTTTPLETALDEQIEQLTAQQEDIKALGVTPQERFLAIMQENPLYKPLKMAMRMNDQQMVAYMVEDGTLDRWKWTEHLLRQGVETGLIPEEVGNRPEKIREYLESEFGRGLGGSTRRIQRGIADLSRTKELPVSLPEPSPGTVEALEALDVEDDKTPTPAPTPTAPTPRPRRAGFSPTRTIPDPGDPKWANWSKDAQGNWRYQESGKTGWKILPNTAQYRDTIQNLEAAWSQQPPVAPTAETAPETAEVTPPTAGRAAKEGFTEKHKAGLLINRERLKKQLEQAGLPVPSFEDDSVFAMVDQIDAMKNTLEPEDPQSKIESLNKQKEDLLSAAKSLEIRLGSFPKAQTGGSDEYKIRTLQNQVDFITKELDPVKLRELAASKRAEGKKLIADYTKGLTPTKGLIRKAPTRLQQLGIGGTEFDTVSEQIVFDKVKKQKDLLDLDALALDSYAQEFEKKHPQPPPETHAAAGLNEGISLARGQRVPPPSKKVTQSGQPVVTIVDEEEAADTGDWEEEEEEEEEEAVDTGDYEEEEEDDDDEAVDAKGKAATYQKVGFARRNISFPTTSDTTVAKGNRLEQLAQAFETPEPLKVSEKTTVKTKAAHVAKDTKAKDRAAARKFESQRISRGKYAEAIRKASEWRMGMQQEGASSVPQMLIDQGWYPDPKKSIKYLQKQEQFDYYINRAKNLAKNLSPEEVKEVQKDMRTRWEGRPWDEVDTSLKAGK